MKSTRERSRLSEGVALRKDRPTSVGEPDQSFADPERVEVET